MSPDGGALLAVLCPPAVAGAKLLRMPLETDRRSSDTRGMKLRAAVAIVIAFMSLCLGAGCGSARADPLAPPAALVAPAGRSSAFVPPRWLLADERLRMSEFKSSKVKISYMLHRPFVVAIVKFDRVVVCVSCIAPGFDVPPRGDTVRLTYSLPRRDAVGLAFCGGKGSAHPRAFCLRRWRS
jgi:hypothetical protein